MVNGDVRLLLYASLSPFLAQSALNSPEIKSVGTATEGGPLQTVQNFTGANILDVNPCTFVLYPERTKASPDTACHLTGDRNRPGSNYEYHTQFLPGQKAH